MSLPRQWFVVVGRLSSALAVKEPEVEMLADPTLHRVVIGGVLAFVMSVATPCFLVPLLEKLGLVDMPNHRSSHSVPTLRGLGVAPWIGMISGLTVFLVWPLSDPGWIGALMLAVSLFGLLGFVEDSVGIKVASRAAFQVMLSVLAVAAAAAGTGGQWFYLGLSVVFIAGYVNVANFMDGINGISAFHGVVVGIYFVAFGTLTGTWYLSAGGIVVAMSFTGFLPWNLSRKPRFLGDVGSYVLGLACSFMAVRAFLDTGLLVAALAPLAIYLADATFTLVRRMIRGEPWYEAHRTHIYQQLTDCGLSHVQVATVVAVFTGTSSLIGLVSLNAGTWGQLFAALSILLLSAVYLYLPKMIVNSARAGGRWQGDREY